MYDNVKFFLNHASWGYFAHLYAKKNLLLCGKREVIKVDFKKEVYFFQVKILGFTEIINQAQLLVCPAYPGAFKISKVFVPNI